MNRSAIRFSLRGASAEVSTCTLPRNRLNDAVPQFAIPLLVIIVGILGEVDEVVRIHVRNLTASLVRPCRCVG